MAGHQTEDQIQQDHKYLKKKLTPFRVTEESIEETIDREESLVFPNSQLTVCCLTTRNGFSVIGDSACVDPENFNAEQGRTIARAKAFEKMWVLEGYAMKEEYARSQSQGPDYSELNKDSRRDR